MVTQRHRRRELYALAIGLANIQHSSRERVCHTVIVVIDIHVIDHLHVLIFIHEEDHVEAAATIKVVGLEADLVGVRGLGLKGTRQVATVLRDARFIRRDIAIGVLNPEATVTPGLEALSVAGKDHAVLSRRVGHQTAECGVIPFLGIGDVLIRGETVGEIRAQIAVGLNHQCAEVFFILGVADTQLYIQPLGDVEAHIGVGRPSRVFTLDLA